VAGLVHGGGIGARSDGGGPAPQRGGCSLDPQLLCTLEVAAMTTQLEQAGSSDLRGG
jgi:hypothetical protein